MYYYYKNKQGFSLIELLVAISIIGILSILALPSFLASNINNQLASQVNQLNNIFSFARSEAYRLNSTVSVCATTNGIACNSSNFSNGTIIFNNPATNGLLNTNQILKVYDFWAGKNKGVITTTDGTGTFTFRGNSSAIVSGSILICSPGYNSFTLTINPIGSIHSVNNIGDGGC